MARAQSQYLRIFSGSTTYDRWQNYYTNTTVSLDGVTWAWLPFDANGYVEGQAGSEDDLEITLPALPPVLRSIELALRNSWLAELEVYEFDAGDGTLAPKSGQVLIASCLGEVTSAGGSFTTITIGIGSALAPVGAQSPPRMMTTRLVGVPCKL